jgi:hypothetical protein
VTGEKPEIYSVQQQLGIFRSYSMNVWVRSILVIAAFAVTAASGHALEYKASLKGFVPNNGQWPSEVLYLHKSPNLHVWITRSGMVFDQYKIENGMRTGHILRMAWEGAHGQVNDASTRSVQPSTRVSMFKGRDASKWVHGLEVRTDLRFADVYPGVDVLYYLDEKGQLRYDLDVKPHANVTQVGFAVKGDEGVQITPDEVVLKTSMGGINMGDLYAYVLGRKSMQTEAMFSARSSSITFNVPQWNGEVPLRIDPVVYGTYIGGQDDDAVKSTQLVENGVVIAGTTTGIEFPQGTGRYSTTVKGASDAFVALLSRDLTTIRAYSYFGGSGAEVLAAMAVDGEGKVCITGTTESNDLPTTVGAVGQLYKAGLDVFVARLSADLTTVDLCTYVGGNKDDIPMGIAVNNASSIYVVGGTTSNLSFPTTLAHQNTHGGQEDAFMFRLSPNGGSFVFCTYYGKAGVESFKAIALDNTGAPFVTGSTTSSDFETAPTPGRWSSGRVPYDRTYNGGNSDAFLIKFFPDGTLSKRDDGTFATFFGGDKEEEGRGIYVDNIGRPVLVGVTNSTNMPAVGTLTTSPIGARDIFMAVFTDDGRGLVSCTYFGGTGDDDVLGMRADIDVNAGVLYGTTKSVDFPAAGMGSTPERSGPSDGFISVFNTTSIKYSSIIGGNGNDAVIGVSLDAAGDIYHVVEGNSQNLPVTPGAVNSQPIGGTDGYVGKMAYGVLNLSSPNGGETWCAGSTRGIAWSALDMNDKEKYKVEISEDGGSTWKPLVESTDKTSYNWAIPMGISDGGDYRIRISTVRGHSSTSNLFTISNPPTITAPPVAVTACQGERVVLRVGASGSGLNYQWRRNATNISGATNDSLVITNLSAANAGNYDVVITGRCTPNATSTAVAVTVGATTEITKQPENVTVEKGKGFELSVQAKGSDLTYQWQKDGTNINNANTATYRVQASTEADAGSYTCLVNGVCGDLTSSSATVVITPTSSVSEDGTSIMGRTLRVLGPIPADQTMRFSLSSSVPGAVVARLFDAKGAMVGSFDVGTVQGEDTIFDVPVSRLAAGTYALEVVVAGVSLRTTTFIAH